MGRAAAINAREAGCHGTARRRSPAAPPEKRAARLCALVVHARSLRSSAGGNGPPAVRRMDAREKVLTGQRKMFTRTLRPTMRINARCLHGGTELRCASKPLPCTPPGDRAPTGPPAPRRGRPSTKGHAPRRLRLRLLKPRLHLASLVWVVKELVQPARGRVARQIHQSGVAPRRRQAETQLQACARGEVASSPQTCTIDGDAPGGARTVRACPHDAAAVLPQLLLAPAAALLGRRIEGRCGALIRIERRIAVGEDLVQRSGHPRVEAEEGRKAGDVLCLHAREVQLAYRVKRSGKVRERKGELGLGLRQHVKRRRELLEVRGDVSVRAHGGVVLGGGRRHDGRVGRTKFAHPLDGFLVGHLG
eukprot:scaffold182874_cov27-Tisochrysis_lutea.AAC.2